eukprot:COSAG06_NODE_3010_length_5963_cov_6.094645_2_plen_226_part_00
MSVGMRATDRILPLFVQRKKSGEVPQKVRRCRCQLREKRLGCCLLLLVGALRAMYSTPRRATSPRLDRSGGRLDRSGGRLDRSDRRLLEPTVYGNYLDRSTAYGANYTLGGTRIVDRRTFTRDVPVTVIEQEEFEVTTHQEPDVPVTHLEYVDRTEYETQLERVERTEYQPVTDEIVVTKTRMSTGLVEDSYTLLEETKEPVIVYQDVETTVPVTVTGTLALHPH